MGVLRFFYWLSKEHPDVLHHINNTIPLVIDSYALDLNALIHPICQKLFYTDDQIVRLLHKKKTPTIAEAYQAICDEIKKLILFVNPKELIIAIDGVAPLSKQYQQRQRRFVSALEKSENDFNKFDSNCISPGTLFMHNLSYFIHRWIMKECKHMKVVFFNEKVAGEGEHKLIRYIQKNYNSDYKYLIHSPDADLIMLCLGMNRNNIFIIRENIYSSINCKYFIVDIDKLSLKLISLLKWDSIDYTFNTISLIDDFILLCIFLGNDFLPHIPSIEIPNGGMTSIMEIYAKIAYKYGHLTNRKDNKSNINVDSFSKLLFALSNEECNMMTLKSKQNVKYRDDILQDCIKDNKVDIEKYRSMYYLKKLKDVDIEIMCHSYVQTLIYILRYYLQEIPDWHYLYTYHYSPFFIDLFRFLNTFKEKEMKKNKPLLPFQQLLSIMPARSKNLLPLPLQNIKEIEFKRDYQGKRSDHEAHVLLPFVKVEQVIDDYNQVKNEINEDDRKRNIFGKEFIYVNGILQKN